MSKPHEEEWVLGSVTVQFPTRRGAHTSGIILGGVPSKSDRSAILRLISAAPDMARALLAVCEHDRKFRESPEDASRSPIEAVTAALAKAGVPLP
jgi:hypothetical protein